MSLDDMYLSKTRHDQQLLDDQCDLISDADKYREGVISLKQYMERTPMPRHTRNLVIKHVNQEG
ncbi:MAG: hypothetical protein GY820_38285 [Gammaproteobacteria bacterium]|nr:hypothetical protein [Gammaproteobacteria bacterium]